VDRAVEQQHGLVEIHVIERIVPLHLVLRAIAGAGPNFGSKRSTKRIKLAPALSRPSYDPRVRR